MAKVPPKNRPEGPGDERALEVLFGALPLPGQAPPGPCPPVDLLGALAEGRPLAAERAALEAHVAECDPCREVVAALTLEAPAGTQLAAGGSGRRRAAGWVAAA